MDTRVLIWQYLAILSMSFSRSRCQDPVSASFCFLPGAKVMPRRALELPQWWSMKSMRMGWVSDVLSIFIGPTCKSQLQQVGYIRIYYCFMFIHQQQHLHNQHPNHQELALLSLSRHINPRGKPTHAFPRPNNYKKLIIHDIHFLTKRRIALQQQTQNTGHSTSLKELLLQTMVPARQVLQTELTTSHHQNDEYLKQNMNTVKQKIRNKFLKQTVDFADSPRPKLSLCERMMRKDLSPERERINKYNHDFEEYLIRKKMNRKCNTLPHQANHSHQPSSEHSLREQAASPPAEMLQVRTMSNRGKDSAGLGQGCKMIVVSHWSPPHKGVKFKNALIETARKSMSKQQQAKLLLKKYVNHHFNRAIRSCEKPTTKIHEGREEERDFCSLNVKTGTSPSFIKSPLNYSLAKRELNKLRKQNIGLPLLLQAQNMKKTSEWVIEERINAKKLTYQGKKQVVYSKKDQQRGSQQHRVLQMLEQEQNLIL